MDIQKLEQLKEKARMKNYSLLPCSVCGEPFLVRDYRQKDPLCSNCSRNANAVEWAKKRYTNPGSGPIPDNVKEKLSKVRSGGPYFKP